MDPDLVPQASRPVPIQGLVPRPPSRCNRRIRNKTWHLTVVLLNSKTEMDQAEIPVEVGRREPGALKSFLAGGVGGMCLVLTG